MRRKKRKIAAVCLAVLIVTFFTVFNTSTRYGRWLYWQESDWGDIDRFAFQTVDNDPETQRAFSSEGSSTAIKQVITDFKINGESLEEFAASHESTALIIVHDDVVVMEKYFQGNRQKTLQSSFSCTKSVVSLLVGIAIDEGLINSVDEPIANYVPGLRSDLDNVTIRQVLTMTSGISDEDEKLFDAIPAPWSDRVKVYYDPNLRRLATTFETDNPPDSRFEYHDFNPVLIGMMLENVTGKRMSQYLSEEIWTSVGMQFPARWSVDSQWHGFEKPAAGLHATAIDFARLGVMLLDSQQTIVSRQWLQESIFDRCASDLLMKRFAASAERAKRRGNHELAEHIGSLRYGYYWWGVQRDGRYDFYANGHFGQFIYISPDARLVIVRHGTGHGGLNDWDFGNHFFKLASRVIESHQDNTDP